MADAPPEARQSRRAFEAHSSWIRSLRSEFNERVSEASMRRSSSEDSEREEGLWRPSAASIASMPGVDTSEARHSQEQLATHFDAAVDLEELEGPVYRSVGVQQPCGGFGLGIEHHEAHAVDGYDVDEAPVYRCVNLEACVDAEAQWRATNPPLVHRQTAFWATPP
jgi:hypothetical protein